MVTTNSLLSRRRHQDQSTRFYLLYQARLDLKPTGLILSVCSRGAATLSRRRRADGNSFLVGPLSAYLVALARSRAFTHSRAQVNSLHNWRQITLGLASLRTE